MTTTFVVCFLAGLGFSVVSFVSGHHGAGHHGAIAAKHASPLNLAAITAFLVWFGGAGMVLQQITPWAPLAVAGAAAMSGTIGGSLVNRFLGTLMRAERPLVATSMIGVIARVTSAIREGGTGEVMFSMNGTRHVSAARADAPRGIGKGVEVVVIRYEKGIAYVCTWEELSAETLES